MNNKHIYILKQLQPKEENRRNFGFFGGHGHRNRNRNSNSGRVPSGRGNEDCLLDYLLIPGARGNQTKYGKRFPHSESKYTLTYKPFTKTSNLTQQSRFPIKGPTIDRFCGGQLNTDTNEDFSIPIYCEVTSNVIWMQVNSYAKNYSRSN